MAGGERERKGKGKAIEPRFNDRKRPRATKAELKSLALKKEGFGMRSEHVPSFRFCSKDGKKLVGKYLECAKCSIKWASKMLFEAGPSVNAHLVDTRDYFKFWRKKLYWRLTFTFHTGVKFSTDPPNPYSVFESAFSKNWQEAAWNTSAGVKTHIRILETTRAVEDFCRFNLENEERGFGAAKLFGSGEIVMIVPPVEVTHTNSPVAGSRLHFKFGWVSMTAKGMINHAENMPEPAEGWAHVDPWVRDHALNMLDCELEVDAGMVALSECDDCARLSLTSTLDSEDIARGYASYRISSFFTRHHV
jgi:hypothetical protein